MRGENSKTERRIVVKTGHAKATSALLNYHGISDQDIIPNLAQERLEDGLLSKCGDPK